MLAFKAQNTFHGRLIRYPVLQVPRQAALLHRNSLGQDLLPDQLGKAGPVMSSTSFRAVLTGQHPSTDGLQAI